MRDKLWRFFLTVTSLFLVSTAVFLIYQAGVRHGKNSVQPEFRVEEYRESAESSEITRSYSSASSPKEKTGMEELRLYTPEPTPATTSLPSPTPEPTPTPAPTPEPSRTIQTEQTVYITKTGTKYHRGNCSYLNKSKISITLSEAKAMGYTPCSRCW